MASTDEGPPRDLVRPAPRTPEEEERYLFDGLRVSLIGNDKVLSVLE